MKENLWEKIKKKFIKIFSGGLAVLQLGTFSACSVEDREEEPIKSETETTEVVPAEGAGRNWKDEIKVPIDTPTEEKEEINKLLNGVDNINSKEALLNWFKNMYASEYEKLTKEELDASKIKFVKSPQSAILKADDKYVSHGSYPDITISEIISDGKEPKSIIGEDSTGRYDFDVYTIRRAEDDKIIDCMTYLKDGGTETAIPLIPGDSYNEMKDYDSILADMGEISSEVMGLYDLYLQEEKAPGNGYLGMLIDSSKGELKELLSEYLEVENTVLEVVVPETDETELDH